LQTRGIELAAAQEKAKADLAVAQAEAAKVQADPTKTKEEKEAAQLSIRAAEAQLTSTEAQLSLTQQERQLQQQTAGLRALQFEQQQAQQLRGAQAELAQTTRRRSDDRQVARAALQDAQALEVQFQQIANTFLRNANQQFNNMPQATLGAPSINANTPQPRGATEATNTQNINSDLNINVNFTGDTRGVNREELNTTIRNATIQGWNEIVDELRRRN
jgi:multidrug efflux pump subunit AcrA (membrane-fusion protein)